MDNTLLQSRYKKAGIKLDGQVSAKDIPAIVESLKEAFYSEKTYSYKWRISQLKALRRMCTESEDELCAALYGDLHKSKFESFATEIGTTVGEIDVAIERLSEWMKPEMKRDTVLTSPSESFVQRDPLGVILIFGSWNYPVYLSLNPIVGAVAAGNCVLLKPGSYATNSSKALMKLVAKYMDSECVKCVEGNREVTSALLEQKFDKIFFTGSGFVGRIVAIAAAKHLTPCVLELGGKSPCVVDKTAAAHLDFTVKRIVWGCFTNCGQTCVRPDFLLVNETIKADFIKAIKKTVKEFYSENPKTTEWFARCINDRAFKRLSSLVQVHKENIIVGGECDASEKYIAPTIFDFGNDLESFVETDIMQDEIFGPLVPVAFYKDLNKVVDIIKKLKTGKPLAAYAFGTDKVFIETMKKRTTSGGLVINDAFMHLANHELPFGGVGNSGMGNYHGKYSFDCFTHEKAVLCKNPNIEDLPGIRDVLGIRFPPYTSTSKKVLRLFFNPTIGSIYHKLTGERASFILKVFLFVSVMRLLGFRVVRN